MRVGVVGAGMTGLAAAWRLAAAGVPVTVFDAAPAAGGLMQTFRTLDGSLLECAYHHMFPHDAELLWALRELGLASGLRFLPATMGVLDAQGMYPLNTPLDFLRIPALSLSAKAGFLWGTGLMTLHTPLGRCDDVAAVDWLRKTCGKAATAAVYEPLLRSKFGDAWDGVPLAWLAGRISQRAKSRRKGQECLGYLDGSLDRLTHALVQKIEQAGGRFEFGCKIQTLLPQAGRGLRLVTQTGEEHTVDQVLWTAPVCELPQCLQGAVPPSLIRAGEIEYLGVICLVLSLDRPLSSTYWINVTDPACAFGGIIEHTNLVAPDEYGGQHLVYFPRYLRLDDPMWQMPDDRLFTDQIAWLSRRFGFDLRSRIQENWMFRFARGATLTDAGFACKIPPCRSGIDGLYLASMCHVYPDERSVNNSLRIAIKALRDMGYGSAVAGIPEGRSLSGRFGFDAARD